jgi:hypothetical protein
VCEIERMKLPLNETVEDEKGGWLKKKSRSHQIYFCKSSQSLIETEGFNHEFQILSVTEKSIPCVFLFLLGEYPQESFVFLTMLDETILC